MAKKRQVQSSAPVPPPWTRYDKFTVAEILAVCARGGKAVKRRVLAYEQANQKRQEIIDALTGQTAA